MFITELRFKKLNKGIIKYCNKLDTYLLEHLTAAWCYFSEQGFYKYSVEVYTQDYEDI